MSVAEQYAKASAKSDKHDDECKQCYEAVEGNGKRCDEGEKLFDECMDLLQKRYL